MSKALSIIIIIILLLATLWGIYAINTDSSIKLSITTYIKDINFNQETQTQIQQIQIQPILTNNQVQHIQIADSIYISNIFNPTIIGKQNIDYSLTYITMEKDSIIPLRVLKNNEIQYYIKGQGKIILNGKTYYVKPGDALFIPKNTIQKTINNGNTNFEFISIIDPAWTPEAEQRFE